MTMRYLILAILAAMAAPAAAATYELKATPQTVAWGHYDATDKPVLTIRSGDTVVIHTLLTNSPAGLEKAGVAPAQIEPALRAVYDGVPASARGPGGHILTGPIAIAGAEPGDMLEVRIRKVDLAIPYAYNAFRYGAGFLTDDFPYARMKIVPLDAKRMVGLFAPGVEVPLAPFFGSMGVAPTRRSSPGRPCSCPSLPPVRCSRPATVMPRRAMARSTSPRSKPR
jgi:acetamidase/formamidase